MDNINSIGNARLILREVGKVIVGKDEVMIKVLLAILAGGHILMEDIPGVGKTTMAVAFSKALGLEYNRVQFTPDVLPSDITGYSIYDKNTGTMNYQKGAILCNLFLADELNRATAPSPPSCRPWRRVRSRWITAPIGCLSPLSSSPPRTPPGPKARRCFLTLRWTALCCACPLAIPPMRMRRR